MTSSLNIVRVKDGTRQPQVAKADLMGSVFSLTLESGEVLLLDAVQLLGFLMSPEHDEEAA